MARLGMVIDTRRCVGCMDCVVACKTENGVPEGFNRDWVRYEYQGEWPSLRLEIRSERDRRQSRLSRPGRGPQCHPRRVAPC